MYLYLTKDKDKVLVQKNDGYEIFDNTNNIEKVLNKNNNIEIIHKISNRLNENNENDKIKILYLNLKEQLEKEQLDKVINRSIKTYSNEKISKYINSTDFINDIYNKLSLIDFYLYIRDCLLNHKELDIQFDEKDNKLKKLNFLTICLRNVDSPEEFINILIEKDYTYSINKQKKLKYNN